MISPVNFYDIVSHTSSVMHGDRIALSKLTLAALNQRKESGVRSSVNLHSILRTATLQLFAFIASEEGVRGTTL